MAFEFRDGNGNRCGSTEFAKALLARGFEGVEPDLARAISQEKDWRKNYQRYFVDLTKLEALHPRINWLALSEALADGVQNENGESLRKLAERGFANRNAIEYQTIHGTGRIKPIDIEAQARMLDSKFATADALDAVSWLGQSSQPDLSEFILVALAGNAELAATKSWLDWGGTVALIARKNESADANLKKHARSSSGTLLYVETGLDMIEQVELCATFIRTLSFSGKKLVLANYGYAPGVNQIKLQAAQTALCLVAMQLPKTQIAFSWLATPLDVIVGSRNAVEARVGGYANRSSFIKLRDRFWQIFGGLTQPDEILLNDDLALFDASANAQGPSYLLAKHSERWLAMQAMRSGITTSFTVAPPAATDSVLGARKILARTYSGLGRFGVRPMDAGQTAELMAGILVRNLVQDQSPARSAAIQPTYADLSKTAIHAGLWAVPYRLDSVWVPASLLG